MVTRAIGVSRRLCARALAALVCALGSVASSADGGRLAVWAIGLPHGGYVVMEHQAPSIHVSAEDVKNGEVRVPGGSRFAITTRTPAGFAVEFTSAGTCCQSVVIDGIGATVELGPRGGTLVQRKAAAGRRVIAVDYRFVLAPGVAPGSYPWPLEMMVREAASTDVERPAALRRLVTIAAREL
ncbi:MAG: hypothetical protein IT514_15125 [Burkholderiales bacterium]|nr:hypothetical protein [Burkholderiales bacterium]